mmetsp:Transcript_41689/g.82288  ORF Transcript_41689/g.82288 Transcript_41689/m.82288 type:complete len:221 (-) Transcript_41689:69-731(-)
MFISDFDLSFPLHRISFHENLSIVFSLVDRAGGLVIAHPVSSRGTKSLMPTVVEWLLSVGVPRILRCDNEKALMEGDVPALLLRHGVRIIPVPPKSSKGSCETWQKILRAGLESLFLSFGFPLSWAPFLVCSVCYGYNRIVTSEERSPILCSEGKAADDSWMLCDFAVWRPHVQTEKKGCRPRACFGVFLFGVSDQECVCAPWNVERFCWGPSVHRVGWV